MNSPIFTANIGLNQSNIEMYKLIIILLQIVIINQIYTQSDSLKADSSKYFTDPIIVTATKTENKLSNTTLPVTVIGIQEIFKQSSVKLSDVLS